MTRGSDPISHVNIADKKKNRARYHFEYFLHCDLHCIIHFNIEVVLGVPFRSFDYGGALLVNLHSFIHSLSNTLLIHSLSKLYPSFLFLPLNLTN